ncbi:MAG: WecB/TagA/CpsF family glycosyltransferase [Patescibacteria group bacterium]
MSLNAVKMLGISVTISPKDTILEYLEKGLEKPSVKQKKSLVIVTPNPEQIVRAQKDKRFAEILNRADVSIPDGIGLALVMRLQRIPGVELMEDLVAMAAKRGYPVALIGGRAGVAVEALECLRTRFPGLALRSGATNGWAMEPGELEIGNISNVGNVGRLKTITEKIRSTGTRIVFVGLGAPKQEYFIARLAHDMSFRPPSRNPEKKGWIPGQARDDKRIVFISVGGSFDIIAGRTPRAPSFVRTVGLEWFWRLVCEPWRWKRQLALLKFLWLVATSRTARSNLENDALEANL